MKKNVFKFLACVLIATLVLTCTGNVAFAVESNTGGMLIIDDDDDDGVFSLGDLRDICQFDPGSFYDYDIENNTSKNIEEPAAEVAPAEEASAEVAPAEETPAEVVPAEVAPAEAVKADAEAAPAEVVVNNPAQTNAATTNSNTNSSNGTVNKPAYIEVTRYNCNCGFTTYNYNELKQHMLQHVLKGQRNSYSAHTEHVLKGQRNSYCTSYVEVIQ